MRKVLAVLVGLPLCIVVVALAAANRHWVTLSLDPFNPQMPALSLTLPLYAFLFAAVILGVVLGSVVTWVGQGRFRRDARSARRELRRIAREAPVPPAQGGATLPRRLSLPSQR